MLRNYGIEILTVKNKENLSLESLNFHFRPAAILLLPNIAYPVSNKSTRLALSNDVFLEYEVKLRKGQRSKEVRGDLTNQRSP
jgi:hypothetical protein